MNVGTDDMNVPAIPTLLQDPKYCHHKV